MNLDWHNILATLSTLILLGGVIPYVFTITKGDTRPNPLTMIGWFSLAAIPAIAQIAKGADLSVVVPIISAVNSLIVLAFAFGAKKFYPIGITDKIAFFLGAVAIIVWILTKEPLTAIFISVIADVIFTIPILAKVYREPGSEPPFLWSLYTLGCFLGFFSLTSFAIQNIVYPIYSGILGLCIAGLASRKYLK